MIKINPLIDWSFKQVKEYIDKEYVFAPALISFGCLADLDLDCFPGMSLTTRFSTWDTSPSVTGTRRPSRLLLELPMVLAMLASERVVGLARPRQNAVSTPTSTRSASCLRSAAESESLHSVVIHRKPLLTGFLFPLSRKELKAKDEAKGGDVLPVVAVEGEGTVIVEPTAALGA